MIFMGILMAVVIAGADAGVTESPPSPSPCVKVIGPIAGTSRCLRLGLKSGKVTETQVQITPDNATRALACKEGALIGGVMFRVSCATSPRSGVEVFAILQTRREGGAKVISLAKAPHPFELTKVWVREQKQGELELTLDFAVND